MRQAATIPPEPPQMSFKNKLAIAFSTVLFLTIIVALTNWWGMGSAIKEQENASIFIFELEQQFQQAIQEEQTYRSSKKLEHSRAVITLLADLRSKIETMFPLARKPEHLENIHDVLNALESYESSFVKYSYTTIIMQTMKSRMLKESKRLLVNAGKLSDVNKMSVHTTGRTPSQALADKSTQLVEQAAATELVYLVGKVLLTEKDFILSGNDNTAKAVNSVIQAIRKQIRLIDLKQTGSTDKLKTFRISKVATVYLDIFNRFVTEKTKLSESSAAMQKARTSFADALSHSLDHQRAFTKEKISSLQYLSVTVSIIAVLLGIMAVIILSNLITRPVNELKHSARAIVDGNLETYVNVTSKDDIGELGTLFNQMTKRLRKSFHDLEEYRDHLEELVKERTEKLQQEISRHETTEEALRASGERLTNIIEQSPMGIVLCNNEFKIQDWNQSCEKIFGFTHQEMIGEPCHKIMHEATRDHVDDIFNTLLKTKKNIRNRNKNITKTGRIITCEWYNTRLTDSSGVMVGMLSLVMDVTEQIQLEKEQLKRKKLESTGVLAGGIAHDFNNILTAILGNINLSLLDQTLAAKTKKLLIAAEKGSIRAQSLTQQLLTFSKGGEPIKKQTSLVEVIRDSADFILHGSSTSCRYHLPDDMWLIDADKGQISQVIQNIVLNASHAMPGGGVIDITAKNVEKGSLHDDGLPHAMNCVKISISDNGVGIPRKVLERIFDPYYSTKKEGSGLGLAISQSIINKHKGHIFASSEPNSSTTFTIYLPASSSVERSNESPAAPAKPTIAAKILIMDDEEMVLDVASNMLMAIGHEVMMARNGDECIRIYQEQTAAGSPPDLVILDLTIPGGKGGAETIRALLQINPRINALVSSGYSNDPIMASYSEYGFCGTMPKPYVLADMAKIIEQTLMAS